MGRATTKNPWYICTLDQQIFNNSTVYKDAAWNVQTRRFYCFPIAYKNLPIKSKVNLAHYRPISL